MQFTSDSLPAAIRDLFVANNYSVDVSVKIAGGEIDLVATPNGNPFGSQIWIEATVERVDNTKYGKDLTKLEVVGRLHATAKRLIVSSQGFTPDVVERATAAGIETLTYSDLFQKFETFNPYVTEVLGQSELSVELEKLEDVYERPHFDDQHGSTDAISWLDTWKSDRDAPKWLIITGEYGTGKTALSKMLQKTWVENYARSASEPIPLRIELRDFTRQFDADGLLIRALYNSRLGHVPLPFAWTAIRAGRVILLLDGYDEMAQYLSPRERRVCLEALAELSSGGARGLLFSRPNYFSETEELRLLDTLYRDLEGRSPLSASASRILLREEKALDSMLEQHFLSRFERAVRDLTAEETEALVGRHLSQDPEGKELVVSLLRRIFRSEEDGSATSLSGKPVIISYILEVVDQLKETSQTERYAETLTEWEIYAVVVDHLMLRDWRQAGNITTKQRRLFLQYLALALSSRESPAADEALMMDLIGSQFRRELARFDGASRRSEMDTLLQDLRRSATLTRRASDDHWRFSHNSSREFLVAEALLDSLHADTSINDNVKISDAMQTFGASLSEAAFEHHTQRLASQWANRHSSAKLSLCFLLLWPGLVSRDRNRSTRQLLTAIAGADLQLDNLTLSKITLGKVGDDLSLATFASSELSDVRLAGLNLTSCDFKNVVAAAVDFSNCDLRSSDFSRAYIEECDFTDAVVQDADFTRVLTADVSIIVEGADNQSLLLSGDDALGYLSFHGAKTADVSPFARLQHHPNYSIVEKIMSKFAETSPRQRLGLEQKGASSRNIPFARGFIDRLLADGMVEVRGGPLRRALPNADRTRFMRRSSGKEANGSYHRALHGRELRSMS